MIHRREFITLLGGAAAWPFAAYAQQGDRVRRIGVLLSGDETGQSDVAAFTQALAGLGWTDGRNVRMDHRYAGGDINRIRALAQELVGSQPDIILTKGATVTAALQRETRTIPIVLGGRGRPCRKRHRCAAQPPKWEYHWLRQLGGHAGRQVA